MIAYAIRRIFLMIPTLFAIMVVNFFIVQAAPGGPVEQMIAKFKGNTVSATERVSGGGNETAPAPQTNAATASTAGRAGIDPALIKQLVHQYGFDKPPLERFELMMKNYVIFDFGNSFFQDRSVVSLIRDKLPVSISIGLWTTLFTYLISIPLGIRKAVRDGSAFDVWTQLGGARRLCGAEFPVRGAAHRAVRRRQLPVDLSAARPRQRQLGEFRLADEDRRLFLAHRAADRRAHHRRVRDADDADQELLSRRDQQAVRA